MSQSASDSFRNVTRYLGQDYRFTPTYIRPRDPTTNDIKPKEQQGFYPINSLWSNSTNGNVWVLTKFINSPVQAIWVSIISNYVKELWEPTLDGTTPGVTDYEIRYGSYVLQDGLVQLDFTITANSATGTGDLVIGNLPVPMNPAGDANIVGSVYFFRSCVWPINTTTIALVGEPNTSTTKLFIYATASGVSASKVQIANQDWNVQGSITYAT